MLKTAPKNEPKTKAAERLPAGIWKVGTVAILGSFLSQLDATVVNVSLPTLAVELHSALSTIQWVTSGYLLALALMLPMNSWLVERIGAKRLYVWCFATFTLSSALCGAAWSAESLVGFRVLQGMSGGLLAPMAQMMIARAAGKHMARVMGYAALPILLGPILGPVLAGTILQHASWRWLFLVNVPVCLAGIVMAVLFLPDDSGERRLRAFDGMGFALLSPGLVLFLYSSDHLQETTGRVLMGIAAVLLGLFVRHGMVKGEGALLDLELFQRKVFATAASTQFLSNGVSYAAQMLVPFYLIRVCGKSPSETGLMLAPLGLGMVCVYPMMGKLTQRFGIRRVAATGAALALAGLVPMVFLANYGLVTAVFVAALVVRGLGQGAVGIPSITAAYASVPKRELPMATTSLNIVQRLGGPTLTTACATFLAWRMRLGGGDSAKAFVAGFALLCGLQALVLLSALQLPTRVESPVNEKMQLDAAAE
ncbi:DHA2 family efflux MFS transporter permease subunit [Acidicapsa ligni]|uniref:DHA2 family efflux MFS transporter permease subunit n=1 Tax=Acidicapsa ligni TaxID=542300 RepID=UPI0021E0421A|nr:DHA2 family efflux MFS transporter permease subunit [Acidicapsa ligni]